MADIENQNSLIPLSQAVETIKTAILQGQYEAVKGVNRIQLVVYFSIGKYLSENTHHFAYGSAALKVISEQLRKELPGLRGYSETQLKEMRKFYDEWIFLDAKKSVATDKCATKKKSVVTDESQLTINQSDIYHTMVIPDVTEFPIEDFFAVPFTHHTRIIALCKERDARFYYIHRTAEEHLSVEALKKLINQQAYEHREQIPNNFSKALVNSSVARKAVMMFKDSYALDFNNVEEIGLRDKIDVDERVIEKEIVQNVKNFIMTFGHDFTFVGNQYHLEVYNHDFFPDLQYVCPMRHLYTLNMDNKQDILWSVMHDFCLSSDDKTIYYRHSDHLGSANWITDFHGDPIQYLHYLPYGELLLNQQVAGYDERYKFTDKERDAESGYDYFGARYYASPLYNWTSVDPLADQSPQISPYAYCNWNPIKFVDPDGEEKHIFLHPSNDENIYESSMNYVDNVPSIHIWAHGNNHRINFYDKNNNTTYEATTVDKLVAFLNDNVFQYSDAWKNHESEGSQAVIVLHSCETGKGKNSIGQQLSEQLPNTVVIAPNEKVAVTKDAKELGAYKTKELVKPDGTKAQTIDKVGAWVMFREGKMIGSFNGATPPNVTNPKQFQLDN